MAKKDRKLLLQVAARRRSDFQMAHLEHTPALCDAGFIGVYPLSDDAESAARLEIDDVEKLDRPTTFFRVL